MADIVVATELILLGLEGKTKEEILTKMADRLARSGYVKDSYKEAVIAREREFATGLPTGGCGVAIPHTDIEHVERAAICVAALRDEVEFVVMGEEAETVPVKLVFMLAMKQQHAQLALLQKLMGIFQDHEALSYLVGESDRERIRAFMIKKLDV